MTANGTLRKNKADLQNEELKEDEGKKDNRQ